MAGKLTYTEDALGHLDRLSDFLVRSAGAQTALKVMDGLLDSFDVLGELPYLGREHPDRLLASRGYRVYVAGRYVGVYLATAEGALMMGVYHTKTDWLRME